MEILTNTMIALSRGIPGLVVAGLILIVMFLALIRKDCRLDDLRRLPDDSLCLRRRMDGFWLVRAVTTAFLVGICLCHWQGRPHLFLGTFNADFWIHGLYPF